VISFNPTVKKLLLGLGIAVVLLVTITAARLNWKIREKGHQMQQGKLIVDNIRDHDATIEAYWSPGVTIRVYGITESTRQEIVISWVNDLKKQRLIDRSVRVAFYKQRNIKRVPLGPRAWTEEEGPEELIRLVKL
jgi:hypothetical protein